jgi:hypothetical protein
MLRTMGFEVGWGSTVGRVKESMHELLDILQVRVACQHLKALLCIRLADAQ